MEVPIAEYGFPDLAPTRPPPNTTMKTQYADLFVRSLYLGEVARSAGGGRHGDEFIRSSAAPADIKLGFKLKARVKSSTAPARSPRASFASPRQ